MKLYQRCLLAVAWAAVPYLGNAQSPADSSLLELQNLSAFEEASALQAYLNDKMGVGSHIGLSSRETPGIVSVITAEEIQRLGARDFIDVMRLVPGFDFASDLDFAIGPTLRGNWAMEGKILLMVDGVRYNDLLYQSLLFGNHLPINQIERVEIVRGPGSAIYGGTAEYGVINITTKGAAGLNGVAASTTYGTYQQGTARKEAGLSLGKKLNNLAVDFTAHMAQANRSNRPYRPMQTDAPPIELLDSEQGQTTPLFVSAGVKYKGLSARFLADDYRWTTPYVEIQNRHINAVLEYQAKIGEHLQLHPKISYTNQLPWHYRAIYDDEMGEPYKIRAERTTASLTAGYRAGRRLYLTAGTEWFTERATDLLEGGNFGDEPSVQFNNQALFGEALLKHRLANITAGLRAEHHSAFGFAMAPRFALTKHLNRWHIKGLASGAYRAPGIENINLNPDIKPERTVTYELETGYQFTPDMLIAVNLFQLQTKDVIVYRYDPETEEEFYENNDYLGSSGVEVVYQLRRPLWSANLSYSYSRASDKNSVETYQVPQRSGMNVGIAAHKASLHGSVQLSKKLSLNPSAVLIGERWGYATYNNDEIPDLTRFAPMLLANFQVQYQHLLPGLTLGLSTHNLLDEDNSFVQAYNGESAPVPGAGREFSLTATYNLNFQK